MRLAVADWRASALVGGRRWLVWSWRRQEAGRAIEGGRERRLELGLGVCG
jgi:hypothetical protein